MANDNIQQYIRENWDTLSHQEICDNLKISINELLINASNLNLYIRDHTTLSKEEKLTFLKNNWNTLSKRDLSKILKMSTKTIYNYGKQLDLPQNKSNSFIMNDDKYDYILENYKKLGAKQLSKHLGCCEKSIYNYARELGLTTNIMYWTKEEDDFIRDNWNRYEFNVFYRKFKKEFNIDRTKDSIKRRKRELKIETDISKNGTYLSSNDIKSIMNYSKERLDGIVRYGYLKTSTFKNKRRIKIDDFRDFLINHPTKWHCSEVDLVTLKSLFTKISIDISDKSYQHDRYELEEWLVNKIELDKTRKVVSKTSWKLSEIHEVLSHHSNGLSVKEISETMNRNYFSIYNIIKNPNRYNQQNTSL